MPFGLQGAPGVFQEMMEVLCCKVKSNPQFTDILKHGFLGAFFDDCGLGTQDQQQHLQLLEAFLQICLENNIRSKLSRCDFIQEKID